MRQLMAIGAIIALAAAGAAGVCHVAQTGTGRFGQLHNLPATCLELWRAPAQGARLDAELHQLQQREHQWLVLVNAVMEGHMSLRAAATALAELEAGYPDFWAEGARRHPGWTRERYCTSVVIELIAAAVSTRGKDPAALVRELWAEYDREQRDHYLSPA